MKKDLDDFYKELKEDGILINGLAWTITFIFYLGILALSEAILFKNEYILNNIVDTIFLVIVISFSGFLIAIEELDIYRSVIEEKERSIKRIRIRYVYFKGILGFSLPISLFIVSINLLSGKESLTSNLISFLLYNIIGLALGISNWMKNKEIFIRYIIKQFYKRINKIK